MVHTGIEGSHSWMIAAPATASIASTIAQNHQYSQPVVNPAHGPIAWRVYDTNAAGPVEFITAPEPTNSPAPITPPSEIIVMCLPLRFACRPDRSSLSMAHAC